MDIIVSTLSYISLNKKIIKDVVQRNLLTNELRVGELHSTIDIIKIF